MYKKLLLLLNLLFCFSVQSALIDHGHFTYDTDQQLDWLDFTQTEGLSVASALTNNEGWRLATNLEIENLHSFAFQGFFSTNVNGFSSELGGGVPYADQEEDFSNWLSLFGDTGSPAQSSRGFYLDENAIWRIIGTTVASGNSLIFGTDFGFDGSSDVITGRSGYGFALVRTSTVPTPPTHWLFAFVLVVIAMKEKGVAKTQWQSVISSSKRHFR